MNKQSRSHHYLPRHYLEGFKGSNSGFFVYDKQEDKIFPSSPGATFFENHLNTVYLPDGKTSVFVEDQYTNIENDCWPAIDRIRTSDSKTLITHEDKEFLHLFLSSLYWRLPINSSMAEQWSKSAFTDTSPVDYFRLKNKQGKSIPRHIVDAIRDSDAFKKSFRLILSMAPFLKDKSWGHKLQNWRFFYHQNGQRFNIVGDNPILTRTENHEDPVSLLDEFVFPLSASITIVNTNPVPTKGLSPEFTLQLGVAMVERARRFVVSHNKAWLEAVVGHYKIYANAGMNHLILDQLCLMLQQAA